MSTTLTEKITTDAENTAQEIERAAAVEVAAIERETAAIIDGLRATAAARLEKEKEHQARVAISKAAQAGKIALQKAKRDHIDAVFAEAAEQVRGQAAAEYVAFFAAHAKAVLPEGVTATGIHGPASRESETTEIANQLGLSASFTSGPMAAGLMIVTADGVYDITLERLMSERRAELEVELVSRATEQ